jgi:hypothetical protein
MFAPIGTRTPIKPSVNPQSPVVKTSLMTDCEKEGLWTELVLCVYVCKREERREGLKMMSFTMLLCLLVGICADDLFRPYITLQSFITK